MKDWYIYNTGEPQNITLSEWNYKQKNMYYPICLKCPEKANLESRLLVDGWPELGGSRDCK
jgi:hypothetical protein